MKCVLAVSILLLVSQAAFSQQIGNDALPTVPAYQGKTLDEWIALTKDEDANVRIAAVNSLGFVGPAAIPALTALLKNDDTNVQVAAVNALGFVGPEAIPALARLLKDEDTKVRVAAARVVGYVSPKAKTAIPILIELLEDDDLEVRRAAADALGAIGPDAKAAVPALTEFCKGEDSFVLRASLKALGQIGSEAKSAIPTLVELLEDIELQAPAAESLGNIGPEAKSAVPVLAELLKSEYWSVRYTAAIALRQIESTGPEVQAAVSTLAEMCNYRDNNNEKVWMVSDAAVCALGPFGPEAKSAVPVLIQLLTDKETAQQVRWHAETALGQIGPEAKAAVPVLIDLLNDQDSYLRFEAFDALGKMGSEARTAVPVLMKLLKDRDLRVNAAFLLGQIGPEAKTAIPALKGLLTDKDENIRCAADEALAKIEVVLPTAPEGKTWHLVWHDEFDGEKLDETKWEVMPDAPRKGGWWSRKSISLDGKGHLVISTLKDGDKFLDGCVRTKGKFEHSFGYCVARVQLQKQPGHWSAFWIMGDGVNKVGSGGRDGTEIDIYEKPWLDDRVQEPSIGTDTARTTRLWATSPKSPESWRAGTPSACGGSPTSIFST